VPGKPQKSPAPVLQQLQPPLQDQEPQPFDSLPLDICTYKSREESETVQPTKKLARPQPKTEKEPLLLPSCNDHEKRRLYGENGRNTAAILFLEKNDFYDTHGFLH
jgi:hypothetical protein